MYIIKNYQFSSFKLIANMHHSNYAIIENETGTGIKYCPHLEFSEEFAVLSEFDHPQIPKAYDYGKSMMYKDGKEVLMQNYIILDHLGSKDFTDYFKKKLADNFQENFDKFLSAFISACAPLGYIHSKNYLHTDIKPGHLMLEVENNKVFFIDFELLIKKHGLIKGYSKDYASPEYEELLKLLRHTEEDVPLEAIASNIGLDDRTDIYSLGALIFEILTEKKWVDVKSPLRDFNKLIPQDLENIVLAMLEDDVANRIPTVNELKQALKKLL